MCGGTALPLAMVNNSGGLSPRVRGNLGRIRKVGNQGRSIPACAGEPDCRRDCRRSSAVYPRVCGGTRAGRGLVLMNPGLSPRVRGNPRRTISTAPATRSIPACAGEPVRPCAAQFRPRVYPRVCGGTGNALNVTGNGNGLSPRVRGNQKFWVEGGGALRSIPACAGEPLAAGAAP